MTWETENLDWCYDGADGSKVTPDLILALALADDESQATDFYWKLDGTVCSNGIAFGSAISIVKVILAMLPVCSSSAKERCLELLGQISVCEPSCDSPGVVSLCLDELKCASWYFLNGLQFDDPKNAWLYVDIIGILGKTYKDFETNAEFYLNCALTLKLPLGDDEMIRNTIADLKSGNS